MEGDGDADQIVSIHEYACGINVHKHHFDEFIARLKKEI